MRKGDDGEKTRASRTTGAKGIKFLQVVAIYNKHLRAIIIKSKFHILQVNVSNSKK